jgi:beta-glucanase (GH16 family)
MALVRTHRGSPRSAVTRGRSSGRRWRSVPHPLLLLGVSALVLVAGCGPGGGIGARTSQSSAPSSQASSSAAAALAGPWKLTWSSDFNKPGALNKWLYFSGGSGFGSKQLEWYDAANASINGSHQLVITAAQGGSGNRCWYGPCQYTSARMETKNTFSQTYGKFEARIKFPAGGGLWPAFWLEGANVYQVGWPACGEIDVVEPDGKDPYFVRASAHARHFRHPGSVVVHQPIVSAFHTYGVVWNAHGITWYVDGHVFSHVAAYTGWPFGKPFFIILNLAVGGGYVGQPDPTTPFPAQMIVDWVHVYRHAAGP